MLLIHSIFVVAFIIFFFLYFTYSMSIVESLQNDVISSNARIEVLSG